jgi:hypothetical protein
MLHLTLEPPFSVGTGELCGLLHLGGYVIGGKRPQHAAGVSVGTGRSAARLLDALRPLPGAAARGRGSHGARGGVSGAQSAAVWEKAPRRQG